MRPQPGFSLFLCPNTQQHMIKMSQKSATCCALYFSCNCIFKTAQLCSKNRDPGNTDWHRSCALTARSYVIGVAIIVKAIFHLTRSKNASFVFSLGVYKPSHASNQVSGNFLSQVRLNNLVVSGLVGHNNNIDFLVCLECRDLMRNYNVYIISYNG